MISMIFAAVGGWRVIAMAAAVIALGGYIWILRANAETDAATIAMQRTQLDQAVTANASLEASLDALKAQHAREVAALNEAAQKAALRASRTAQTIQVIRNAPATDDAPVAPVLSRTLDGLRRAGTSGGGAKPGGAP